MEIFRDLFLRGERERLAALMADVERSLPQGWTRDRTTENRLQATRLWTTPVYSFLHDRDESLPAATIFFLEEPGLLTASNIIPRQKPRLSYREYNVLLEQFCEQVIRPCAERRGVEVELTSSQADLSNWLSDTAEEKLRSFSTLSNKYIGCLHPLDQKRWIDFIVTAHQDGSQLHATTLRRWLTEIEDWSPEIADQLVNEYAFGGEVLAFSRNRDAEDGVISGEGRGEKVRSFSDSGRAEA
jgi:hypothetical protein